MIYQRWILFPHTTYSIRHLYSGELQSEACGELLTHQFALCHLRSLVAVTSAPKQTNKAEQTWCEFLLPMLQIHWILGIMMCSRRLSLADLGYISHREQQSQKQGWSLLITTLLSVRPSTWTICWVLVSLFEQQNEGFKPAAISLLPLGSVCVITWP